MKTAVDQHRRSLPAVTVAGAPLKPVVLSSLREVRVEQSLHVPDAFTLRFDDHDGRLLTQFTLGAAVEIGVDCHGVVKRLIDGEITGLSADMDGLTQQQLVVTGLDRRHRLTRGVKVRAFARVTDSDVVKKIAGTCGFTVRADSSPLRYDYVLQSASDFDFVNERARACGFDWWIEGNVLHFRRRANAAKATVTWGQTLRRFRLRVSSAESGSEAIVRGWDHESQRPVVGQAPLDSRTLTTDAPLARLVTEAPGSFLPKRLAWGAPVQNRSEGEALAYEMAARLGSEQALARGEALGDPALRPGVTLRIDGLAPSLCGNYQLSRVEHLLRPGEAYVTRFESGGAGDHTLVDLLGAGDWAGRRAAAPGPSAPPLGTSLVVGVVTSKRDPEGLGRVKVKFSGLDDSFESAWARVVSVGAGASRGLHVIPEVNDEVLLGFEYGDVRRPLVLGGLWNGRDNPCPRHVTTGAQDGAVWRTRTGHILSISDGGGAESYARLALASGKTALRLGADGSSLETERDLTVDSAAAVAVKGQTNVTVEAMNVTVKALARLVLQGAEVEIKATGPVRVNGAVVDVTGQGAASLGSGGVTQVKGSAVKIN